MHAANDNADLEAAADRLLAADRAQLPDHDDTPPATETSPDPAAPAEDALPEGARCALAGPAAERFLRSKPARWATRDLDLLGRWLPLLEGSAAPLHVEHVDGGPVRDGRPDTIDRASGEFSRAVSALQVLEQLAPRHRAVLWYAYVATGAETREAYERGEVRIRVDGRTFDVKPPAGWLGRVALVASTDAARAALLLAREPSLRELRLRTLGARLLAEALGAYVAARCAPLAPGRRFDTARAREGVERANDAVDRAVIACTRARSKSPANRPQPRAQQRRPSHAAAA